jgi:serine/threonine protein kinase
MAEQRLCTLSTLLKRLNSFKDGSHRPVLLAESVVCNIVVEILEHLSNIHHTQIKPHCRVRPWNIDFTTAGRIIVEYRAAKNADEDRWYLTPERLMGFHPAAIEQDSWSVGAVMAEMLLGEPLFSSSDSANQLYLMFKTLGFPSRQQVVIIFFVYASRVKTYVSRISLSILVLGTINWSFQRLR